MLKCIDSWKKFCPDYKIREWNEKNFDVTQNAYMWEAYEAKKWAFVSDYVRLSVLVNYGGIYLDTDYEIIKPIDGFLDIEAWLGFEVGKHINIQTAIMGCRKRHPLFVELLKRYDHRHFTKPDGSFDLTTNVKDVTEACLSQGLVLNNEKQTVGGCTFFPTEYFCPKNAMTHIMEPLTENTHGIHHFAGSWKKPTTVREWTRVLIKMPEQIFRRWITKPFKKLLKAA